MTLIFARKTEARVQPKNKGKGKNVRNNRSRIKSMHEPGACRFCRDKKSYIDYKDVDSLQKLPRRIVPLHEDVQWLPVSSLAAFSLLKKLRSSLRSDENA